MVPNSASLSKAILRLELSHVIFGAFSFGRVMYYTALTTSEEIGEPLLLLVPGKLLFFLLVTFMMLVISVLMFLACLVERLLELREEHCKSLFEVLLYGFGCFLYFIATVSLIMHIVELPHEYAWSSKWSSYIGAAMFASWNTITYLISLWAFVKLRSTVRLETKESDAVEIIE